MSPIERRARDMINPYSTAFTSWRCRSGGFLRLNRLITGSRADPRPAGHHHASEQDLERFGC